jgi:hypothetical protein
VPPQSPGLSLWASDLAGATRVDRQWSFNGTTCARLGPGKISVLFWLDNLLSALRGEYNIHDGTQQGLCLRQLVSDEILHKLSRKIDELPDLRRAAAQGEATFDDYAAALIACSDPDDALACHYAASHPQRQPGERLGNAAARADLAFRAAAAHHCQPPAAGRFWAVYGVLSDGHATGNSVTVEPCPARGTDRATQPRPCRRPGGRRDGSSKLCARPGGPPA